MVLEEVEGKADGEELAKKKKRHGKRQITLPMATLIPIGVGVHRVGSLLMDRDYGNATKYATGVNIRGEFEWAPFMTTYGPIGMGIVISWLAGKFGVNKRLGRAGVPLIRI